MPLVTVADRSRAGSYEILATAHEGPFSVVNRCRDTGLARDIAVKAVQPDAPDHAAAARRLSLEARVRASVQHPHVLPLFRVVRSRGGPLLIGPWLSGGTLAGRGPGPLPLDTVVALADGLGGALDALHAAGWTHGDLNPSNVLFDAGGRPVLADFGCARRLGTRVAAVNGSRTLTTTPHTLAPEVWAGRPIDSRIDVYGLGVLLYHALTGSYPFDVEDAAAFPELHLTAPVPRPSLRAASVGAATELVLLRALAKSPEARPSSGAELAAALRTALADDGLLPDARPLPAIAPLEEEPAGSSPLPFAKNAIDLTVAQLERFEATLDDRERLALRALLERARVGDAIAVGGVVDLTRQVFGPPFALLALEECGAAEALAAGPRTAEETAAACGSPPHAVSRIMEVLAAAGLLGRDEADRYHLPLPLATLYRSYRRVGATARPVRDQMEIWRHLSHWATTSEPHFYTDTSDGSVYARVVGVLGTLYGSAARELAAALQQSGQIPAGARVLDIGAGSGVWSIATAMADPAVRLTALDRPVVLEMTRAYAEASGVGSRLDGIAGDWRDAPLPPGSFDIAILANICHLESPEDNRVMVRRARDGIRPGGRVVIVDTMPERRREATLDALLQGLDLSMRTPGGGIYDRESYAAWMEEAGLTVETYVPLHDPTGRLRALVGRRPA